jgi:hypothetical protein
VSAVAAELASRARRHASISVAFLRNLRAYPAHRMCLNEQPLELGVAELGPPRRNRRQTALAEIRFKAKPTVDEFRRELRPTIDGCVLPLNFEHCPFDPSGISDCSHLHNQLQLSMSHPLGRRSADAALGVKESERQLWAIATRFAVKMP